MIFEKKKGIRERSMRRMTQESEILGKFENLVHFVLDSRGLHITKLNSSRNNHGSQVKLGSSLNSIGGSAILSNFSLSALRNEVQKILAQKRRAIASFRDDRVQDVIEKFMEMSEVKEIDKKFATVEGLGPFSSLIKSCEAEVAELQHSELLVSIFGSLKVGKSTLGNLLLEKKRFASADTPMTSFVTNFHSSPKKFAKASFVPYIETAVDIHSLMLVAGIDDPELEQKYIDLFNKEGVMEEETIPDFVVRPVPQLRYTPIISRLDVYGPIWDIVEPGIAVADCPGTKEVGALSNIAHHVASNSAVIVYVSDGASRISIDDEDVQLVREQLNEGADVLFVVNKKPENSFSDVLSVSERIESVYGDLVDFSESPIHILDIIADKPKLELLQLELSARLHQRTRVAVSLVLNFLTELIRAQHLFVSRLLTLHVSKQAEGLRKNSSKTVGVSASMTSVGGGGHGSNLMPNTVPNLAAMAEVTSARHKKEVQAINNRMKVLWRACQKRIEEAGLKFNELIVTTTEAFEAEMRLGDKYQTVPVPVTFNESNAAPQSFLGSVFNPQENEFEREYRRQLQMLLHPRMEHSLSLFGREAKRTFTAFVAQECFSIEASVLELKSEQAKLVWNRQSAGLFQTLQTDLGRMVPRQQKVAGVAISAVGIVGAATLSGVAMAGLLAGSVLTGGALLFVGLVMTGIGLSAASLIKDKQAEHNEKTTRRRALARLTDSIKRSITNEHFTAYRQQTVKSLEAILSAAIHVLSTNLIEIESVWYLDQCALNIDYHSLCSYLWLRDELTEITNDILDAIRELDDTLKVSEWTSHSFSSHHASIDASSPQASPSDLHDSHHSQTSLSSSGNSQIHQKPHPLLSRPSTSSLTNGVPASYSMALTKLDQQQLQQDTRHNSCYVCWRPRTPCGHLCRDCDFLIGPENCPYCHELPHWIANKIKMSAQAKRDLEILIHGAPPSLKQPRGTLSRHTSMADFSLFSSLNHGDEKAMSSAVNSNVSPTKDLRSSSASVGAIPASSSSNSLSMDSRKLSEGPMTGESSTTSNGPNRFELSDSAVLGKFVFDDQKQRVRSILVSFEAQFDAFCKWFESKYSRYLNEPSEPETDVPLEALNSITYFVNAIISQIPSIETALSYSVKMKIVECTHESIFERIGALVHSLVRAKYRLMDDEHVKICQRGKNIKYGAKDSKDWTPSKADPMKLQQAIDTLKSLSLVKSPYAKFQIWTQVWKLIHDAHKEVIASEDSWPCLTYIIVQASHPHMPSDGFIILKSLELLLEGEGYMITTIGTFCTPSLLNDVVSTELSLSPL